jgi:hypothetical protein
LHPQKFKAESVIWLRETHGTPEKWERAAAKTQLQIDEVVAQIRAAGWGDVCAGEAIRDGLETIEICSINVELLKRTGSFDDPAWIERRSLAAHTRLEVETDPVLLPGYRKIVRKWNEKIMRFQMMVRVKSRMACGNQAGAEAAYREFAEWMKRPDRKASDSTGRLETPFQPSKLA